MFTADDNAGVRVVRESYPEGEAGIQKSLRTICAKVREGAPTPIMRSFAGNVLRQAGFPRTGREKGTVLCNHVKNSVGYAHDPPGTELIQSAAVTLCVEGAPVCIPIEDCDGIVTALATLCASSGMEVEIVRQFFGNDHQQHVICEVKLEDGTWFPLDATSPKLQPGQKAHAVKETRMNPWGGESVTGLSDQAEFIGIGGLPVLGLGADGRYHTLPSSFILGPDEPQKTWYDVGQGVQASKTVVKTIQVPEEGPQRLEGLGLGDLFPSLPALPKLTTGAAVAAGAAIIGVSAGVAAIIRKVRHG